MEHEFLIAQAEKRGWLTIICKRRKGAGKRRVEETGDDDDVIMIYETLNFVHNIKYFSYSPSRIPHSHPILSY